MHDIDVKTAEPNVAPSPLRPWPSRLLVSGGLAASLAAHIAVGGAVLFASPRLFATTPEQAIAIDIVTPSEFEQASKGKQGGDEGATPELKPASQPTSVGSPKSSPDASAQPPRQPVAPQPQQQAWQPPPPQPQPEPQLQPQTQFQPPKLPPPSMNAPISAPSAADAAPKPEQQAPEMAIPDPAAIVDLLHLPVQMADAMPGGPASETPAKLTPSEIAEFKAYLKKCWVPPAGIPQTTNKLKAVVRIALGPDGRLMAEPALLAASASVYGPSLVQSVMKGLAQCQPYSMLPAEKYTEWRILDLSFSQDDVAGVNPAATPNAAPKG